MLAGVRRAFRAHPLLSTAFAVALLVTVMFVARTMFFMVYWTDPAHRNQPLEGWMTPRYVTHSWGYPPEVMRDILGPAMPPPGVRRTLHDIARDQGIPLDELIDRITSELEARGGPEGQRP